MLFTCYPKMEYCQFFFFTEYYDSLPVNTMTLLQRCCDITIQSCSETVAMETSDDVAKTMSLQRPIKRRRNETLQQRRFCNVIRHFHCNYMATSERRQMTTP